MVRSLEGKELGGNGHKGDWCNLKKEARNDRHWKQHGEKQKVRQMQWDRNNGTHNRMQKPIRNNSIGMVERNRLSKNNKEGKWVDTG